MSKSVKLMRNAATAGTKKKRRIGISAGARNMYTAG